MYCHKNMKMKLAEILDLEHMEHFLYFGVCQAWAPAVRWWCLEKRTCFTESQICDTEGIPSRTGCTCIRCVLWVQGATLSLF